MNIHRLLLLFAILLLSSGCTVRVYKDVPAPTRTVVVERPARTVYVYTQPQRSPRPQVTIDYRGAQQEPRPRVRRRRGVRIDYNDLRTGRRTRKCANLNPNVCVARGW